MRKKFDWEIKTLGKVAIQIYSGSTIDKEQLQKSGYPIITYKDVFHSNVFINSCKSFINFERVKNKKYCGFGDVLIPNRNNTKDTLGKTSVYLGKEKCIVGMNITLIKHDLNPRYLSFALESEFFKHQIIKCFTKGTVYALSLKSLKQLKIPLPPLEEQERIVSILDKFHTICEDIEEGIPKLIEECEKQYEYYRNQIFS